MDKNTHCGFFSFLYKVYGKINAEEMAVAVLCDLSNAFDCIDSQKLLKDYINMDAKEWFINV